MIKLLEFPHSHYCEKARWALDYKGIPFETVTIMPGVHVITVRRYAKDTSVPVLVTEHINIQGSSEIIDYLEQTYPQKPLTPDDAQLKNQCLTLEKKMDSLLGESLRQIFYYHLLDYPDFVRYCFIHPLPAYKQVIFKMTYPLLKRKIYSYYVVSEASVKKAYDTFHQTMSSLESYITHKDYLVGDQFSRADLSVCSMLSFFCTPDEHPFPWVEYPDNAIQQLIKQYENHAVYQWVRKIYSQHRLNSLQ